MFINESYFTTPPLYIAQLGHKAVVDDLYNTINKYETRIMQAAMGYDFYIAFLNGLNVGSGEPIDQRWLNLLNGVAFKNIYGTKKFWVGFAGSMQPSDIITASDQRQPLFIYGGTTPGFPIGGYTYTDASLKGWTFSLETFQGTLQEGVDWNYKSGGGIVMADNQYQVQPMERWVLTFTGRLPQYIPASTVFGVSPLAGFIWWQYMYDIAIQNTGVGLVESKSENATKASPAARMANVWNASVFDIRIFWEMLQADTQLATPVYPEFDPTQVLGYNEYLFAWLSYRTGYYNWRSTDELYSFAYKNPYGI